MEVLVGDGGELARWRHMAVGEGAIEVESSVLRLIDRGASRRRYTNAQIDDYQGLPRRLFRWRPPLTLNVRARFSHPAAGTGDTGLLGTAGFGFWNDPFLMTDPRPPALPSVLWFFYASPPSDMKLDVQTPGWGWKAAMIDAARWPALLLLPLAPLAVPLMNLPALYRRLWPAAQRALRISEAPVRANMAEWHDYTLAWTARGTRFGVDGQTVLQCQSAPRGPLGLVIWVDNQYMVAMPWGRLRHGLLDVPHQQWLELERVTIQQGELRNAAEG